VGTTLWFSDDPFNVMYRHRYNDFALIPNFEKWVYTVNAKAKSFLEREVEENSVVVTHFSPSYASVPPMFKGSDINRFFVCDMQGVIWENQPALWLHGHTHTPVSYAMGATKVCANPFGYVRLEDTSLFNQDLVLEI
jgi:Icc-related predicted phosphoesterase